LRLLLDEMYPPVIAEQLRARGYEVQSVTARGELRALPDKGIFAAAQEERRAIVTENIADFSTIANRCDERGVVHYGVIFVDPAKYKRGAPRTIGRMVEALDLLLREHTSDRPLSRRQWL
jgi:hypothetical protein